MTTAEFSTAFDLLYNNISSNKAPAVDEYEKSLFLTKAQLQIINEYFNKQTDAVGGGFDGNQRRQYDFSSLIRVVNLKTIQATTISKLDNRSLLFLYPQDYFLAVNDILADNKKQYSVYPINHIEYQRLMLKPYPYPAKKEAWKLINSTKEYNYYDKDDYYFLTTRNLETLTIKASNSATLLNPNNSDWGYKTIYSITYEDSTHPLIALTNDYMVLSIKGKYVKITGNYSDNVLNVEVIYDNNDTILNDSNTIDLIKQGLNLYNTYLIEYNIIDASIIHTIDTLTDSFSNCSAPYKANFLNKVTLNLSTTNSTLVEIIGKFKTTPTYMFKYVRVPKPIILTKLDGETIGGMSEETQCELPKELHNDILDRAVLLAKMAWQGTIIPNAQNKKE